MDALFADDAFDRRPRVIAPGAVWLPGFLDAQAQSWLLRRVEEWRSGPVPPHSTLIAGHPMSVRTIGLGWHWRPGRYERRAADVNDEQVLPFPEWMMRLGRKVVASAAEVVAGSADAAGSPTSAVAGPADPAAWGLDPTVYSPDVALVNHYDAHARMGMHQDRDEVDPAPVVSLSLGDTGLFRFGNTRSRNRPFEDIRLASGDAFVFGGPARFAYHGVRGIVPDTAPEAIRDHLLGGGRINITMRTTGLR
ncbi:alkylated DNA repair protein (DNA oxidative demethylase) [Brevibacterium sanguinis]|uniref:Alkylated DNA repair protein (DNA oxidative demethylase) n=2 Tax=Brevibacterium TaxID=1696 RepID=A0A366IL08_9MICO|nr:MULTISPECIES: alpha-ketoglutarate-dependent dioxygenase AlkB [Brevibacterium]RBP64270.1 alkylated DNA repair protein (DNA oxidative demethylase) [Brevibacterium sanguinis]RBP71438.1 alkylated DNA repair protein (DNA oxidative demethylase) [Brevibacterium celere]